MKKIIAILLATVLMLTSVLGLASCAGETLCQHRDENDDSICDVCEATYTDGKDIPDEPVCQHRDEDDNNACDACGEDYIDGQDIPDAPVCQHRDADDNGECDKCEEAYTDGKDIPDDPVCQHRDADDNDRCDLCDVLYADGKDVPDPAGVHVCSYSEKVAEEKYLKTAADKENAAVYYYSCLCGEMCEETFVHGLPLSDDYLTVSFNYNDGTANLVIHVKADTKLTAFTPIRNGYTFGGWYYVPAVTDEPQDEPDGETGDEPAVEPVGETGDEPVVEPVLWDFENNVVTADLELVAKWTESEATLGEFEYNSNKTAISVNDEITAELFGVSCKYSDGTVAIIDVTVSGNKVAGGTVDVRFTVSIEGEVVKQLTIKGVMVYGAPTLDYNSKITWINIENGLTAEFVGATAKDSFGNNAKITVSVAEGCEAGSYTTVTITATDAVGNKTEATIDNVKTYGNPEITYNKDKKDINETDTLNSELFGASATDSFGNLCTVTVTCDNFKAGQQTTVTITATDEVGNVKEIVLEGIKVYGEPVVEADEFLFADTDKNFAVTVYDSFGVEIANPEVTYAPAEYTAGDVVTVTVKATDSKGNSVEKTLKYVVDHAEHEFVNGICKVCEAKEATYDNYVYFGEYPQTLKEDSVTFEEGAVADERGYFLGSDGCYYAKVVAAPSGAGYKFSTDAVITSGTEYYFKVEPIRWRILSKADGTALVICDSIIGSMAFDEAQNGYTDSAVRKWLNETFLNTAFTEAERALILTTTVDNSAESTGYENNPFAEEATEDRVFLLSYAEVHNAEYGFDAAENRQLAVCDYARATGAAIDTDKDTYGNGSWWLRSPFSYLDAYTGSVNGDGSVKIDSYTAILGVVPVITIQL